MPAVMAAEPYPGGEPPPRSAMRHRSGGHGGEHGSSNGVRVGSRGQAASPSSSTERMYSAKQLTEALKSGLAAVKDQLQVLAILDGTALSWPGVSQAIDDMDFLTDMVAATTTKLEGGSRKLTAALDELRGEAATLREALAAAGQRGDALQQQLNASAKELRDTRRKLDETTRELQATRQEVWTLEKQRADTASELDRTKQDLEYTEGELEASRNTVSDQTQTISGLKEELAARKADVGHLKQLSSELRSTNEHLKSQLGASQESLASSQATLQHTRQEKQHYEKESGRLAEEAARLGAELDRSAKEVSRLKEWQDVLKKVEADKLREEQEAHARSRSEAKDRGVAAEKLAAGLRAEIKARDERLAGRDAELDTQRKQAGMLQLQLRDLAKQLSGCQGDLKGAAAARDESRQQVARLQADMQRMRLEAAQRDKERSVAESRERGQAGADKAALQAKLDEALREATLARKLADGWQRDAKEQQAAVAAEQARTAAVAKELEAARSQLSERNVEQVRSGAAAEQQVAGLRQQLASKDEEIRRVKADALSMQKQLEKAIERLQREVDASAAEIARLKAGEDALFTRLPPVARANTIQEDLENLRRALRDRMAGPPPPMPYSAGAAYGGMGAAGVQSLPALGSGSPGQHLQRTSQGGYAAGDGAATPQGQQQPPQQQLRFAVAERPSQLRNRTR